ncbi:MAG TPA: hypothetical protein VF802_09085 [Candidatus Limnocylindrales bacterium]
MEFSRNGVRRSRWIAVATSGALLATLLPLALASTVAAAATQLAFSSAPASAQAGSQFAVTVIATTDGTTVSTDFSAGVTLTTSDSAAVVAQGTPFGSGTYTFNVTLKTAGTQTLTASATGLATATKTVSVTAGAAAKLAFLAQPASGVNNVALPAQPRVEIEDANGNRVPDSSTGVNLTLNLPSTREGTPVLAGCSVSRTTPGVADFFGCRVVGVGHAFTLTASATGLTPATSAAFDVSSTISFQVQPGGGAGTGGRAQGGIAFSSQPRVTVRWPTSPTNYTTDVSASDNTTVVTLAILSGTGVADAKLTCDQTNGSTLVTSLRVTAGTAQFTNCRIDKAGTGYRLVATSSPAFPTLYSNTFDVVAGPATQLTFLQEPASGNAGQAFPTQPIVAITDAGGNVVTSGVSTTVVLSIGTNTGNPAGVLTCVPSTAATTAITGTNAGKAIFGGCSISTPGQFYTLVATAVNTQCYTTGCTKPTLAPAYTKTFAVGVRGAELTVAASARVITWRGTVVLTTSFAMNGANKMFRLEATRDMVNWYTIATPTTNAAGVATFSYTPATNLWYRAVYAPTTTTDLTAGTSPIVRVVVRQIALLRPHYSYTRTVALGSAVTFSTTVRPIGPTIPKAKVTYYLYRRVSGTWRFLTTRTYYINDLGIARFTWKFGSRGDYYLRAMAQPTPFNANSVMSQAEFYRVR